MATIYGTDDTAKIRIGEYGVATKTAGVEVPDAVAAELEATYKNPGLLRIVRDERVDLPALPAPAEPEPAPAPKRRRQE
jgi:hypothetical protein